jgi:hypothetical protein
MSERRHISPEQRSKILAAERRKNTAHSATGWGKLPTRIRVCLQAYP